MKILFKAFVLMFLLGQSVFAENITGGDSIATATVVPTFNEVHRMSKDTNDKYLKFDLQKGEGVSIILTGYMNSGSMNMYVYNPEDQSTYGYIESVFSIVNGETDAVSFTAHIAGTYYLKVTGSAGIADITVYQSFDTVGVSDSNRDFYHTFNTAFYLSEGDYTKSDQFSNYYRFEVEALDEITISLTASVNSGSMHMYVYSPEDQSSYIEYATSIVDGETDTISFTAYAVGVYYLKVTGDTGTYTLSLDGVKLNRDTDNDGLYNTAEYIRGTKIDRVDTNGNGIPDYNEAQNGTIGRYATEWNRADIANANSVIAAKEIPYYNAPISLDKDVNDKYFKFELQEGESLSIALTSHLNAGSMSMYAYSPEDQSTYSYIASAFSIGDSGTDAMSFTASTTGTYYLKVTGSAGMADIALYQSFDTVGVRDSNRDFHHTFNTAFYLSEGDYTKSNQFSDYYRFEVEVFDTITISLTASVNSGSMHMYVYSPEDQSTYGYIEYVTSIVDGETDTISFTAYTPGIYYLKVTGDTGIYNFSLNGVRENPDKEIHITPVISYLLM